jgi:hypothetical protein
MADLSSSGHQQKLAKYDREVARMRAEFDTERATLQEQASTSGGMHCYAPLVLISDVGHQAAVQAGEDACSWQCLRLYCSERHVRG